jgi:hypothetical protein
MAMTVYVIQNQKKIDDDGRLKEKFDFTPATKYGELKEVISSSMSPFDLTPVLTRLHEVLSGYKTGDYLLLTGNPVFIGLAVAIAADYNGGDVSLLQWSGIKRAYVPINAKNVYNDVVVEEA